MADPIQFEKADFSDATPKCGACQTLLENSYFHLAGHVICPACAEKVRTGQGRPPHAAVVRGLVWGAGIAVVCSLIYGLILLAGIEFGLVAIGVGYAVGRAVRAGAGGLGGRRCQVAAVLLTYLAISLSYLVPAFREVDFTPLGLIAGAISLAVSYIGLQIADGGSGILSLAILSFGLFQAWKQTARDPRALTGPFSLRPAILENGESAG